jgi:hypothetical protein
MRRSPTAVLAAAALAIFAGVAAGSGASEARGNASPSDGFRLQRYGSCDELVRDAREHTLRLVGAWGLPTFPTEFPRATQFEPPGRRPGVDYSTTNVQEEGIDEPDLVKTDGSTIFTLAGNRLHALDVNGDSHRLVGSLKLEGFSRSHELLLRGRRLLVLSRTRYRAYQPGPGAPRLLPPYDGARTTLTEVDVRNPAEMRIVRTLTLDGQYVAARLHGSVARVVLSSAMPHGLRFTGSVDDNRRLVQDAPLANWLPGYELKVADRITRRYLVLCRHVWKPRAFSGTGLLTVFTADLDRGLVPTNTVSILSDAQTVYASPESLYVATERWADRPRTWSERPPRRTQTTIHKFGIASPERTRYRASGSVFGFLLGQWSLSEHEGVLRVASTETPVEVQDPNAESVLTTLREREGRLVHLARLGGLGRGERLMAVRFFDGVGYAVTFRIVDPLYTIDLSDPEKPRLRGELTIPGYSTYLHPAGDELMLGVGQDATGRGDLRGLQLSLFHVGNPRNPSRLHKATVFGGRSDAEFDHHAFLYWPRSRLAVVPVSAWTENSSFTGAMAFKVGRRSGVDRAARIRHPRDPYVVRSVVVGSALFTISGLGIEERSLARLTHRGWYAFPTS